MERTVPTIIPSIAPETADLSLDRLLFPARFFRQPDDVVTEDQLDIQESGPFLPRGHRMRAQSNLCRPCASRQALRPR